MPFGKQEKSIPKTTAKDQLRESEDKGANKPIEARSEKLPGGFSLEMEAVNQKSKQFPWRQHDSLHDI